MASVDAAIEDYVARYRSDARRELDYFRRVLRSDEEVVRRAALAELPSGKRHPHQRRVPRAALEESERRLIANLPQLRQATNFDELLGLINDLIRSIPGVGELTVYDTSVRIGARFGLEPGKVYLHAGTRAGAIALGYDGRRQAIEMDEFPYAIRLRLHPREAQDLLCIYKSGLREDGPRTCGPGSRAPEQRACGTVCNRSS
jgi:hypothetical protein